MLQGIWYCLIYCLENELGNTHWGRASTLWGGSYLDVIQEGQNDPPGGAILYTPFWIVRMYTTCPSCNNKFAEPRQSHMICNNHLNIYPFTCFRRTIYLICLKAPIRNFHTKCSFILVCSPVWIGPLVHTFPPWKDIFAEARKSPHDLWKLYLFKNLALLEHTIYFTSLTYWCSPCLLFFTIVDESCSELKFWE